MNRTLLFTILISNISIAACGFGSKKISKKTSGTNLSSAKTSLTLVVPTLTSEGNTRYASVGGIVTCTRSANASSTSKPTFSFYNTSALDVPRNTQELSPGTQSAAFTLATTGPTPDNVGDKIICVVTEAVQGQNTIQAVSAPLEIVATSTNDETTPSAASICAGTTINGVAGSAQCGTSNAGATWTLTGLLSAFPGAGYIKEVTGAPTASTICTGTTVVGVTGTAVCQTGVAAGTETLAGEILAGRSAWKADGTVINGSMTNQGNWNINTTVFPGIGYYTGITSTLSASDVCSTKSLYGTVGTAVCQGSSGGTNATAASVLTGTYFWNSSGASTQGTMPNRGAWDLTTAFPGAGYVSSVSNTPSASALCTGTSVAGVAGSAMCGGFSALMGSGLHRNSGGTPTQMTIAGERAAANSLAAGYREIPELAKDDEGTLDTTNVNEVTRGTTVWDGVVPRIVCGMGEETVAARIAACDAAHSTKPGWDATAGDGKISWNGAVNGNASEGSWTLVTVYDPAKNNGDTCAASCREVWQDDRTGLIWSDKLGDLSADRNKGIFSWCMAAGNVENEGTNDCRSGVLNSYNKPAVSLCAEATGLTTPSGIHNATSSNDITTWADSGTSIKDAKGGMLRTANSDTEGAGKSPSVRWRLPTKYDWEIADANGATRVLPNALTGGNHWTSTVMSNDHRFAFYFHTLMGTIGSSDTTVATYVRCVGR